MSTVPKGIDDLLASGGTPTRLRGQEVETFFRRLRARLTGTDDDTGEAPAVVASRSQAVRFPFPVDVFPRAVAEFVTQVATALGCPTDFPGVATLVVAGGAIGAARSLHIKGGWYEQASMYAVIVASPGRAKTPALKAIMGPVYEEQDLIYENHKAAERHFLEETAEYRHAQHSGGEGDSADATPCEPVPPPPMRHLFAGDTTTEALAANLDANRKGILLFRDELTAWVASLNQYRRGADRQFFLSAWSGEMIKTDRRSRQDAPIIVPHPFLSVLGGIQPDLLGHLEVERNREDGFLHRILFSYPREQRFQGWSDVEIDEDLQTRWGTILRRLLNLQPITPEGSSERPRAILFSQDGRQAFIQFINGLADEMNSGDIHPRLIGACAKLRSYCARFALTVHLLRWAAGEFDDSWGEGVVDAEDVARAVRLCNYFREHAKVSYQCLKESAEDKQVAALVAWMRRKQLTSCSARDVARANVADVKTSSAAYALFEAAVDRCEGEWENPHDMNRRSRRFVLTREPVITQGAPTSPTAASGPAPSA